MAPETSRAGESTATNGGWPQNITAGGLSVSVYEPQIEAYDKKVATARAAFSMKSRGSAPLFGAFRFTAVVVVDDQASLARFSSISVTDVKYPEASPRPKESFVDDLKGVLGKAQWTMPLERFRANREDASTDGTDGGFENTPPHIFYEEVPAVLVYIDGEPILKEVKGGYYKYVVNTAYFIVLNPDDNHFYLRGGRWWYRTTDLSKTWQAVDSAPAPIAKLAEDAFKGDATDADSSVSELTEAPKVIVSTEPAELIVVDGKPELVSIEGTSLLYVNNTEDDVLFDIRTQKYYVLVSGRWYTAKSLVKSRWQYVRPDRLPNDFARIPADSAVASVRASVAGTREAEEAVLETEIPQTAEINRATATVEVQYDGVPKFKQIRGTRVYYAINASTSVLRIHGRYYVVDDGVWFESSAATGPWAVSVAVPPEVYDIPPSAPVYAVRYVYIYDYTPAMVYVGYTPGYYCAYVDHGTVIYGTGYYYRPWYGVYYFPHPVTFGFGVHYHPYVGWWGYPVGVSYGWLAFGWFPFPHAYWGPSGYVYGYRHGYYHHHAHDHYHGHRNGYRHGYTAGRSTGYRASRPAAHMDRPPVGNVYKYRTDGVQRTRPRITDHIPRQRPETQGRFHSKATGPKAPDTTRRYRPAAPGRRPLWDPGTAAPRRQTPEYRSPSTRRRAPEYRPAPSRQRSNTTPYTRGTAEPSNQKQPSSPSLRRRPQRKSDSVEHHKTPQPQLRRQGGDRRKPSNNPAPYQNLKRQRPGGTEVRQPPKAVYRVPRKQKSDNDDRKQSKKNTVTTGRKYKASPPAPRRPAAPRAKSVRKAPPQKKHK